MQGVPDDVFQTLNKIEHFYNTAHRSHGVARYSQFFTLVLVYNINVYIIK